MGYLKTTVKGASWMGVLRGVTRLVTFGRIAILARILTPFQFGIFGIASFALAFLEKMTGTGINIFLIQERADLEKYVDTAWIVSILRGLLITGIILISAPLIAVFFNNPGVKSLIYLISFVPLIRGFINPSIVRFQKELEFNKEFSLQLAIFIVHAVAAVTIAFITRSATSLVWALIVSAFFEVIVSHLIIKPRPKLRFEKTKFKLVVNRGKWVTLAGIFDYLFREGDDLFVGKLLASTQLGVYQMAYKIASLPVTEVADTLVQVTFPVLTKISDEAERLKKTFLRTIGVTSLIVVPLGLLIFFLAEPIVVILLGKNWLEAVKVVKVLAFFGPLQAVIASVYPLFLSVKKQEYVTYITLAGILGMVTTIIPLINAYGIIGAALSTFAGVGLMIPTSVIFIVKVFRKK